MKFILQIWEDGFETDSINYLTIYARAFGWAASFWWGMYGMARWHGGSKWGRVRASFSRSNW